MESSFPLLGYLSQTPRKGRTLAQVVMLPKVRGVPFDGGRDTRHGPWLCVSRGYPIIAPISLVEYLCVFVSNRQFKYESRTL